MIDLSNLTLGSRFGSKYTFTAGVMGSFSGFNAAITDGRKVKDPLIIDGSYFEAVNAPDPKMINITSNVTMATYRTFDTTDTVLSTGIQTESEQVDLSLYKSVIDFSSAGVVGITAIPKDQLIKLKNLINIADYVQGINTIAINLTNIFCKFAITIDDGVTYQTYDSVNKNWVTVDITQTTDLLKTAMSDYTVLNALTATDYSAITIADKKIGIALLIGIEGTDTTKTYSLNKVSLDYVGTNDTSPTIQYFNWVFSGYDTKGNPKFIADRVLQKSIAYSTLYTAKVVDGNSKIAISNAEIGYDMYMRLPKSGISKAYASEYDSIINSDIISRGGKTIDEFWNTAIASLTNTIASAQDTDGNAASATSIVARGGSLPGKYLNVLNTALSDNYGFRPVITIYTNNPLAAKPRNGLDLVTSVASLVSGKGITCEYTATGKALGSFANLGKATKGYLNDFSNDTPDGTFVFNFAGYTKEGKIKLVADRVIHTNISYSDISTGNTPSISSGLHITIDGAPYILRLLHATSDPSLGLLSNSEYDSIITNAWNTAKTVEQIWHTSKSLALCANLSTKTANFVVVRGMEAQETDGTYSHQWQMLYTDRASNVGFRPMLIVEPSIKVEGLVVTPYVGYEKQDNAKIFTINATVINTNNQVSQYALLKADNTVLSDYSTAATRTIDVSLFDTGKATTINIVEKVSGTVVYSFDVYRDSLYRSNTTRTFGRIYSGYGNTNIQITSDKGGAANPIPSSTQKPVLSDTATFITIPANANKITFS